MDKLEDMLNSYAVNYNMRIEGRLDESNMYVIKLPETMSQYYTQIFDELDDESNHTKFNLKQYNIRVTSLEEVFNQLGEKEQKELLSSTSIAQSESSQN